VRAVILAAGTSSRIGAQKLLMPFRGRPLIDYAIAAASRRRPVVVCGAGVAAYLAQRPGVTVVRNDEPELGMSHSLALANRIVEPDEPIAVLLADKPLVDERLIETIGAESLGYDVTYPQRNGAPGHPVVLSSRARERVDGLPPGDTLRLLRDDPRLTVRAVDSSDEGAFFDVDTLEAFER
jgi:molybdenum cofactor cytidylyltransferase